eukprot:2954846-Rhodomonas_salina.2
MKAGPAASSYGASVAHPFVPLKRFEEECTPDRSEDSRQNAVVGHGLQDSNPPSHPAMKRDLRNPWKGSEPSGARNCQTHMHAPSKQTYATDLAGLFHRWGRVNLSDADRLTEYRKGEKQHLEVHTTSCSNGCQN